jgi:hypothetical protein
MAARLVGVYLGGKIKHDLFERCLGTLFNV